MISTTKRAKCRSGSHSSTDGGIRKPVSRSIGRKLLMWRISSGGGANRAARFYRPIRLRVKSDRLLGKIVWLESALDKPRHWPVILFNKTDTGCLVPTLAIARTKIEDKPCVIRKHTKPEALCSPVAVDEGMAGVDLVDVSRRVSGQFFLAATHEIAVTRKLREKVFHPRFDIGWHSEWNRSSAGRVIPLASCPLIEVLKKVAVNCFEACISPIVGANGKAFIGTVFGQAPLGCLKNC